MGGSSVTAGVRLVVLATLATQTAALFSCFEWPSVVDPELTVRYISTDNCSHDAEAIAESLNMTAEQVQCTNSAGMLSFGDLCVEAAESMAAEVGDGVNVTCDGGYIRTVDPARCDAGAASLNLAIHNYTAPAVESTEVPGRTGGNAITTVSTTAPVGAGADSGGFSLFQADKGPTWIAVVCAIGLGSLLTLVSLAIVSVKLVLKHRKRVRHGTYSGDDELGFNTEEAKGYKEFEAPSDANNKTKKSRLFRTISETRRLRGGTSNSALAAGSGGGDTPVRYHHHDWCADLQTKAHLYGVNGRTPGSGSAAYPKRTAKSKKLLKKQKAVFRSASTDFSSDSEIDNSLLLF